MTITGNIKTIKETQTYGQSGFRKRELVLTTNDQYPQPLLVEFVQDKCDLLDQYKQGQDVTISINLRGREWINPQGEAVYFNSIQGWRIEAAQMAATPPEEPNNYNPDNLPNTDNSDLPF